MTVQRFNTVAASVIMPAAQGRYALASDYDKVLKQNAQMAAENAALKESVNHAAGCIHAAEVEGLEGALQSRDGEKLADLVHRRLCHAYLPVETPVTDACLNSVRAKAISSALVTCTDHCDTDYVMDAYDFSYEIAEMRTAGAIDLRDELVAYAAKLRACKDGE